MLTEGAVRASDKRAQFGGVEAYEDAGGVILRDLFNADDGGWLQDPGLLDRLVTEKLNRKAEIIQAEGWKWVEVSPDFPYGHTYDLRRLIGEQRPLTEDEIAAHDALRAELDKLEESYCQTEDTPEEVDRRLAEIESALAAFEERPVVYDPDEIARAGAFVSIDGSGALRVERGYVRPGDEPPVALSADGTVEGESEEGAAMRARTVSVMFRPPENPGRHDRSGGRDSRANFLCGGQIKEWTVGPEDA
jgi:ParB family transcriptional regulator, chromosome partitioning protein